MEDHAREGPRQRAWAKTPITQTHASAKRALREAQSDRLRYRDSPEAGGGRLETLGRGRTPPPTFRRKNRLAGRINRRAVDIRANVYDAKPTIRPNGGMCRRLAGEFGGRGDAAHRLRGRRSSRRGPRG